VEVVKELPAQGVQKPSRGVGEKWFTSVFLAAPAAIVKVPAGLRTRPTWWQLDALGGRQLAWPLLLGLAVSWVVRRGVHSHACLEVGHGNDFLSLPDLESEGTGSLAEDSVGAM
jgi:hypothetical protein